MTFSFYAPPSLTPAQSGALPDIIGNILKGYTGVTNARYLQPNLEEALKKAKLYNQYYGPNIESEIGLRGAQAGHLGAETQALNISNPFLRKKLEQEQLQRQYELAQAKSVQDAIYRHLSGQSGQPQPTVTPNQYPQSTESTYEPTHDLPPFLMNQKPQSYQPGLGSPPFSDQQREPFTKSIASQQPEIKKQSQIPLSNGAPILSDEDIYNKKIFGTDTYTPKYKAWVDTQTAGMKDKQKEEFKLEAKKDLIDYKDKVAAEKDIPVLQNALKYAIRMQDIIESRPAFFGKTPLPIIGKYYNPAERFANTSSDPLAGEFMSELIPQLSNIEKQLSSRGSQLALKTGASKLPSFENSQPVALGRVHGMISSILDALENAKNLAGGNIIRKGNKRFIEKNGKFYEIIGKTKS